MLKKLKNTLHFLLDFTLYGNLFIAFCAAVSTYSTGFSLNLMPSVTDSSVTIYQSSLTEIACFIGAATFFLYNLHKPVTYFLRKQFIDNQRFTRTKVFRGPLSILSVLAAIFCIYYFFRLKLTTQCLLIFTTFLSLGYVLPILGNGRRLRDIPYLKIVLIAVVWSIITIGLPFLELSNNNNDTFRFLYLFAERSCFIFALCIPFDIRDMDWDSQTKVKTIPLTIGVRKAKILAIIVLIIALTLSLSMSYLTKNKNINWVVQDFKSIVVYTITAYLVLKTHKNRSDYFFYGGIDGMILLKSILS